MLKHLKSLKTFFKLFFQAIENIIRSFVATIKEFFKAGKKIVLCQSLLFVTFLVSFSSVCIFTSYFNNNIGTNLERIAIEYYEETKSNPNIAIYYHQIIDTYDDIVYSNPEFSREVRNIFNIKCYDLYGGWENSLGIPGVIDYLDSTNNQISFIKWPKFSYTANYWLYDMPLIPTNNNIPNNSSPNDIFINKKYADKLLFDYGFDNYSALINRVIKIPYLKKSHVTDGVKVDVEYIIKGVLDESQEYDKLRILYGDFFIASELLSLPLPAYTHVSLSKQSEFKKIFDFLLKRFDYETNRNYLGSNTSQETFQCRISLYGEINSKFSINNIENNMHKYGIKTNRLFESFVGASNLIPIIIGLLLHAFSLSVLFFLLFVLLKMSKEKNIKNKKNVVFFNIIIIIFELIIGLFLGRLLVGLYSNFAIAYISPLSLFICILELLILSIIILIKKRPKNVFIPYHQ